MKKVAALLFLISGIASAATISTITCAGGTATVTVANSLVASQGFEITGSSIAAYNVNATAATANSTSFTFATTCAGSATGGTFTPAPQIIILAINTNSTGYLIQAVFWNTTISPSLCPSCSSLWPSITAAQLAAIKAGTTVETPETFSLPLSTSTSQMNTLVTTQYSQFQAAFALGLSAFSGWCYNGTAWSATCN
jgi:hypothetical protein